MGKQVVPVSEQNKEDMRPEFVFGWQDNVMSEQMVVSDSIKMTKLNLALMSGLRRSGTVWAWLSTRGTYWQTSAKLNNYEINDEGSNLTSVES